MDTNDSDVEAGGPGRIAIVGMAGRFPGASNIDELWQLICARREAISFFERDELDPGIDPVELDDPRYVAARGVVEDADCFDAQFFGIAPREAQVLDPQSRLLLEVSWEALENAGYNPKAYEGLIGVFAGTGFNSYLIDHVLARPDIVGAYGRHLVELANAPDYLATRISYKLDLKGPSISLFTGCSTSLVAVCHAVDSLLSHQSDMALAGGSFVVTPLKSGYVYHEGEMMSPDGHTRPFDADARGTVFCTGAGMVLLKRLEDALADGDHIYAVIRGTGLNNDGSDKVSFTAPSVDGQSSAIAMAHAMAEVTPDMVGYIETHGTGTPLGDPIEIKALTQAFGAQTRSGQYCALGSVKGNIGHLDAAAGVAGLIKTALALYHRKLPPNINFNTPNPAIPFVSSPFYVNTELKDWPAGDGPRIAGVSSFGVGGTNAHVVMEEPPAPAPKAQAEEAWTLLPFSARTPSSLDALEDRAAKHLASHPELDLGDVAHTLQQGREHFPHRSVVVCRSVGEAADTLGSRRPTGYASAKARPAPVPTVFMFSGQGSQHAGMCAGLYQRFPEFRAEIDRCAEIARPLVGMDLRDLLLCRNVSEQEAGALLSETRITQPALFMVEYALAQLWRSFGVEPAACVGHSIGEYVAACIAGVMSLEDALRLVVLRGRLMFSCERGSMLSVMLPLEELSPLLPEDLCLAAVNAPNACVASGPTPAVAAFEQQLAAQGIGARLLQTSHAFHSSMMDPITEEFRREVAKVPLARPSMPYLSNVTGTWISPDEATRPDYWSQHLRNAVLFSNCVQTLLADGPHAFIEVGPGTVLRTLASLHSPAPSESSFIASCRGPKDAAEDAAVFYRALGSLWAIGQPIRWPGSGGPERRRVPLVSYPFERSRHWIDRVRPPVGAPGHGAVVGAGPVLPQVASPESGERPSSDGTVDKIIEIWKAALGYERIRPENDFFELGGDSLMGSNVIVRLKQAFNVDMGPADIYTARTAEQLARLIDEKLLARDGDKGAKATAAMTREDLARLIG